MPTRIENALALVPGLSIDCDKDGKDWSFKWNGAEFVTPALPSFLVLFEELRDQRPTGSREITGCKSDDDVMALLNEYCDAYLEPSVRVYDLDAARELAWQTWREIELEAA